MTVCGLILAAGAGSRFGAAPKLLADLHGRPLIEYAIASAQAALERVVVVLGAHAETIRSHAHLGGTEVTVCSDWADGQAASLRHGLEVAGPGSERVLVLLGDQPLVRPAAILRMAAQPPGSRAAYGGRPGHPVVLGPDHIDVARRLHGDQGLRDLVSWRLVELGSPDAARDVDTPGDLDLIRRAVEPPAAASVVAEPPWKAR